MENTGFANVITEALAIGNVGVTPNIFAFTHGRGAWRVPTAAASPQLSLTPITNGTTFAAGQTLNISVAANNPGLPILVDFYLGVVAPDGKTIVFITQGAAFGVGSISNLASFVPFVTGLSLTTPFNVTVPLFSHLWDGTEPAGPYVLFVEAWRSGSTELVARGQSFFTH